MKKRKFVDFLLLIIFLSIAAFCAFNIYSYYKNSKQSESDFDDIRNLVSGTAQRPLTIQEILGDNVLDVENPSIDIPEISVVIIEDSVTGEKSEVVVNNSTKDLNSLQIKNEDFVGWINIPDTRIDYPVMQTNNNPDFYLRKNFDKKYSLNGIPYAEEWCDTKTPGDNITIYGHHMKDGSMFCDLENFKNQEYTENHKYITFETVDYKAMYEVVYVYKAQVYTGKSDEFKYWNYMDFESEDEFDEFLSNVKSRLVFDTGRNAKYGDKLISLSTCEYSQDNGRLVVVGKMIAKLEKNF